jgi:hypothetical protein
MDVGVPSGPTPSGAFKHALSKSVSSSVCKLSSEDYAERTHLNQVHPFRLLDNWLELGSGEGVYQSGLRHDEKHKLDASENRELVRLRDQERVSKEP